DDLDRMALSTAPVAGPAEPAPAGLPGRYVVLDMLGAGGMGVVHIAYDRELDRKVALKLVAGTREGAGRVRLLREAQALAKLKHPNVVTVYDVGTLEDRLFVAMELVEGTSLRAWLAEHTPSSREAGTPGGAGARRRSCSSPPAAGSRPPTPRGSSTATSSPTTCSSAATGRCAWRTSAWLGSWAKRTPAAQRPPPPRSSRA